MLKIIRIIVLSLLLVALSIGFYIWVQKKTLIRQFLAEKLNMQVEIDSVSIGWGKLVLKNLQLKNHTGSTLEDAFQGDVTVITKATGLFKDHIHIDHIEVKDPIIYLELYNFAGNDNNWSRILNSFPATSEKTFIIEKLSIYNLQFNPIKQSHSKKTINLPKIPYLEFEHLGNKNPLTITQVTQAIFESILYSLTSKPGLGEILKNVQALPKQIFEGATSSIPLDVGNKLQGSWNFLKRKTLETKEALQHWISEDTKR